jgi:hypothetical protein
MKVTIEEIKWMYSKTNDAFFIDGLLVVSTDFYRT